MNPESKMELLRRVGELESDEQLRVLALAILSLLPNVSIEIEKPDDSPIRDFLCRLRAEKDEEPFTNPLNLAKRAIILEYLTEQIEKLEVTK